jgi:hypothetical protein
MLDSLFIRALHQMLGSLGSLGTFLAASDGKFDLKVRI